MKSEYVKADDIEKNNTSYILLGKYYILEKDNHNVQSWFLISSVDK